MKSKAFLNFQPVQNHKIAVMYWHGVAPVQVLEWFDLIPSITYRQQHGPVVKFAGLMHTDTPVLAIPGNNGY